jgi:choloylglycine hydrolase
MGAIGLPGDLSSASRFVKATFTKLNSLSGPGEVESVTQFFHILRSVAQQRGCVHLGGDKYEYTIYSSCCNTDTGTYYYTTYEDQMLRAVNLRAENLDGTDLISYPLIKDPEIRYQN